MTQQDESARKGGCVINDQLRSSSNRNGEMAADHNSKQSQVHRSLVSSVGFLISRGYKVVPRLNRVSWVTSIWLYMCPWNYVLKYIEIRKNTRDPGSTFCFFSYSSYNRRVGNKQSSISPSSTVCTHMTCMSRLELYFLFIKCVSHQTLLGELNVRRPSDPKALLSSAL